MTIATMRPMIAMHTHASTLRAPRQETLSSSSGIRQGDVELRGLPDRSLRDARAPETMPRTTARSSSSGGCTNEAEPLADQAEHDVLRVARTSGSSRDRAGSSRAAYGVSVRRRSRGALGRRARSRRPGGGRRCRPARRRPASPGDRRAGTTSVRRLRPHARAPRRRRRIPRRPRRRCRRPHHGAAARSAPDRCRRRPRSRWRRRAHRLRPTPRSPWHRRRRALCGDTVAARGARSSR